MVTATSSVHGPMVMARRAARAVGLLLIGLLMLGVSGWGVLALHYWDHANPKLRDALAAAWAFASLALIVGFSLRRWRWRSLAAFTALFGLLLLAWSAIQPSNDRAWVPENAVLAYADIDGERITLHNIRNFNYRTDTDFTPAYYDRTFDLRQLDSVDMFTVYWAGPAIAHVFLSFGFTDGSHVAFSIETRREKGQAYSSIAGFFRQYTASVPRVPAADQLAQGARRVVQHPHQQLHQQHLAADTAQSRPRPLFMEDPLERSLTGVSLRAGQARHERALRGASATGVHQPAGPGGGPGRGFLPAHSCRAAIVRLPVREPITSCDEESTRTALARLHSASGFAITDGESSCQGAEESS